MGYFKLWAGDKQVNRIFNKKEDVEDYIEIYDLYDWEVNEYNGNGSIINLYTSNIYG